MQALNLLRGGKLENPENDKLEMLCRKILRPVEMFGKWFMDWVLWLVLSEANYKIMTTPQSENGQ